jgi:hypothetical protein
VSESERESVRELERVGERVSENERASERDPLIINCKCYVSVCSCAYVRVIDKKTKRERE